MFAAKIIQGRKLFAEREPSQITFAFFGILDHERP